MFGRVYGHKICFKTIQEYHGSQKELVSIKHQYLHHQQPTTNNHAVFEFDVCLLAELLELLVPVFEALATEAESLGLEVNWQKTMMQALGNTQDVPLLTQCWSKRLEQWRNLSTLALSSTRQLTAFQTS